MSSSGINPEHPMPAVKIGIIGGSGMCAFPELQQRYRVRPETRYGLPSDDIQVCEHAGMLVAFLPRHGEGHSIAPHKVPYKANLAALHSLGVEYVIGTCIVGSLKIKIAPGSFVVPDQFVNLTWGRDDYADADGGTFTHLPMADPYCQHMREEIGTGIKTFTEAVAESGTVVVIQGPRFSTRAESQLFIRNEWDIVNMTQYPECYLARELGMCYGALASVTDYDVGVPSDMVMEPHRMNAVLEVFRGNIATTKQFLLHFLVHRAQGLSCTCSRRSLKMYYENG